jgi:PAS domain S-box-containing protein
MHIATQQEIRILHVDDDPSITDLTGTFLEREDDRFAVEAAISADEGLERINDCPPDCVVSDYNMSGMNGIEFLQAVRKEYPDLPFILFTGKGSEAVASDAISANVTDYLQKGSGTEQYELLANRIRNAVHARRETRRADRQEQLMRLTEFAGETGGFEIDMDSGDLVLTDGTRRLVGLSDDTQITLEEGIELYHPDDQADVRQTLNRAVETGEKTHGTWRLQTLDGDERLVNVTLVPATENGDTTILRGSVHDVTERRERRRELEQIETVFNNAQDGLFLMNADEGFTTERVNPAYEETRGVAAEEVRGQPLREVLGERAGAVAERQCRECVERRESLELERTLQREGEQTHYVTQIAPVVVDGSVEYIAGSLRNVTAQRERQQELQRLQQAIDDASVPITLADPSQEDNPLVYVNDAFEEMTGYPPEETLGRNCRFLQGEDTDSEKVAALRDAINNEEQISAELRNYRKDGTEFWNRLTVTPIYNDDDELVRYLGTQEDVTERKRRESRFQALVEESNDVISIVDADGVFQYQSPSVERILGYEPEETIGDTAWEYVHPDDRADLVETFERGIDDPDAAPVVEYRARHADGSWRWLEANGNNQLDNPAVEGYVVNSRDISERKEREQELERTQDLLSEMEELAGIGAWEYDPDTGTTTSTAGARRIHGVDPDSLPLNEAFEFFHPEDRESLRARFEACLDTGEPYEMDARLTTAEGTQRWVTARGERVDRAGSDSVVRGYIRDITEEKTREQQLTELNQALQDLLTAETRQRVADIGVRAAREVLDLRATTVHLCEDDDTLTPVAQTDEALSRLDERPALSVADSIAERVYRRGEPTVVEDARQDLDAYNSETDLRGRIYLPLADHGLLIAGSNEKLSIDQQDLAFSELLAGNLVAAFDRIEREQTARQRRERLSLFFEQSPLGAVQWDDEFQFERVNRRAEEILGYSEAELRGESWETIVAEEDREQVGDAVEALLAADGGAELLNRNVRKDDEVLTCEWHNRAVTDENGDVRSVFSKFQNVTDRERRKTELEEYETIIGALSDAVYVVNEEGQFTYVSDEFVELVGYDRETVLGNTPSLIKDEDAVRRAEQELGRLLSSNGPEAVTFEVTIHPREGDPIVCEDHMGVLPYEGEEFDGSVGTLRDITDRKARERELGTVSSQYKTLVENFPDGAVFLFDTELEYVRAGGQELSALGLSPEEVTGTGPRDLFPEEIADETVRYYKQTVDGASHTFEQEFSGEQYRVQTTPVRTGDGEIAYGLALSQNVTEETERRQELERQNERLEEFASIVSHDLRNPLRVADGRLELIRDECASDHIDDVAQALDRMDALIEDLLTLAREGNKVDEIEPIGLANVAENGWQTVKTRQATLDVDTSQVIEADRSRLQQLFENLYRNAVEHGGDDVIVSVGAMDDGFYVADTGPGIPESDREKVFEAGYSTNEDGTGFGLRIVQQIAEAHGWEITVTESEDGGARFEITEYSRRKSRRSGRK